jgi:hypothetical protein
MHGQMDVKYYGKTLAYGPEKPCNCREGKDVPSYISYEHLGRFKLISSVMGFCEHGDEISSDKIAENFLERRATFYFPKASPHSINRTV